MHFTALFEEWILLQTGRDQREITQRAMVHDHWAGEPLTRKGAA